ncbi:DUF3224 domain-containing protein [Deinococcus sp.]|uniref:DUF3224 domain-containing protein n=1 Tax=Deinococcus sp. TaxID=47478 RepID=UPI0025F223F5|nr:DUF3224 domain-containing protein [Deinococcus sp.]
MTTHASGTFEVQLSPQPAAPEEASMGRLLIAKQFSGDLDGHSAGQMLSLMTEVQGSAGYVALERFSGTLHGRAGSFALQHSGSMDRGAASLSVRVVPDSGTGEPAGLAGEMTIDAGAGHAYTLSYTLPG